MSDDFVTKMKINIPITMFFLIPNYKSSQLHNNPTFLNSQGKYLIDTNCYLNEQNFSFILCVFELNKEAIVLRFKHDKLKLDYTIVWVFILPSYICCSPSAVSTIRVGHFETSFSFAKVVPIDDST